MPGHLMGDESSDGCLHAHDGWSSVIHGTCMRTKGGVQSVPAMITVSPFSGRAAYLYVRGGSALYVTLELATVKAGRGVIPEVSGRQ